MVRSITVQIDGDALDALRALEGTGLSHAEAIEKALIEAAANLTRMPAVIEPGHDPDSERDGNLAAAKLIATLNASR